MNTNVAQVERSLQQSCTVSTVYDGEIALSSRRKDTSANVLTCPSLA